MTIYVLEGPDLAGKTTLADEITKIHHERGDAVMKRKMSQPDREATQLDLFGEYFRAVQWAALTSERDTHVIFDRLHVGEWIYGHHKRGNSLLTFEQITALDQLLDSVQAKKIFVDVEYDALALRYRQRGDDYVNLADLATISHDYRDMLFRHNDTRQPDLFGWNRVFMTGGEVPDVVS
uniref:Thymidylate kinase n=1 Tax=Micrococcus phage Kurnik TaxID=3092208 RepID=A0AAU6R6D7_9CAUD